MGRRHFSLRDPTRVPSVPWICMAAHRCLLTNRASNRELRWLDLAALPLRPKRNCRLVMALRHDAPIVRDARHALCFSLAAMAYPVHLRLWTEVPWQRSFSIGIPRGGAAKASRSAPICQAKSASAHSCGPEGCPNDSDGCSAYPIRVGAFFIRLGKTLLVVDGGPRLLREILGSDTI
jgi:hypothetical protein